MKFKLNWVIGIVGVLLLSACSVFLRQPGALRQNGPLLEGDANVQNGERIYFQASSVRGTRITYQGGPNLGGMMGGYLTCAACHGPGARGGLHTMHMQVMDAPDITYGALSGETGEHGQLNEHSDAQMEYSLDDFRRAVIDGKHPDGESLSRDMPRWQMSDEDLADLLAFLKTIQ